MRPKIKLSLLALFVAAAMIVPVFHAVNWLESGRTDVRIYFNGQYDENDLRNLKVKALYDSFAIASLTDPEIRTLESSGYDVENEPDLHTIALNGYVFDTRDGEPGLESNLKIGDYPSETAGHYLLQFVGPVKDEWKEAISRLGAKIGDYVPSNAFIVQMDAKDRDEISKLDFVQWTGTFQPAYKIRPDLLDKNDEFEAEIITYEGNGIGSVLEKLTGDRVISAYSGSDFGLVKAVMDSKLLLDMAKLEDVRFIEPLYKPVLTNENMQWIHQTDVTDYRKLWDLGIDGTGQIIAYADTGLDFDHNFFRQSSGVIVNGDIYNVTDMSRRKLIRYMPMSNWTGVDPFTGGDEWAVKDSAPGIGQASGHGTMVAGTGAGRDDDIGGISTNDGLGRGAKIFMQDIGTICNPQPGDPLDDCLRYIPDDYYFLYIYPYNDGARIHSNSWGTQDSSYDLEARMTDAFMWSHPDMLVIFSNGNGGPGSFEQYDVGSPATAKSIVSAGAAGNVGLWPPTQNDVASYSSRGPTTDGRLKPTVTMVGEGYSSASDGNPWTSILTGRTVGWLGTSYAAPAASGAAALIRQYFTDGWYPTGTSNPVQGFDPSAALVKAVLAASGTKMTGQYTDSKGEQKWPNMSQGWGRPNLDKVLYFAGDPRELSVVDYKEGLITGDQVEYKYFVNAGEELKIQLVWTDYPGTLGAASALVNNLNLEVTAPNSMVYKGNVFSTPFGTSESRAGGLYDAKNPIEGVRFTNPATGIWKVRVIADNIPAGPQPFALVVSGDLDPSIGQVHIDKEVYGEYDDINIEVQDLDAASASVTVTSTTETSGEVVPLTPVGSGIFRGMIRTRFWAPSPNGTIEVSDGDTIVVSYNDISPVQTSTADARVDAAGPEITDVFVKDITNAAATVTWMTDEPSDSRVYWGNTSALGKAAHDQELRVYHEIILRGLETGMKYYFDVESTDWMGHSSIDTNGEMHYTFTTTSMADILLVIGDDTFPPDRVQYYRNALEWGGWSYNMWFVSLTGDPPLSLLQQYRAVLWQTGEEQYPPFEDSQRTLIADYLDGGGRFFLSSHDAAWALSTQSSSQFSTPERYSWLKSTLKVDWKEDPYSWTAVEGIIGDPISNSYAASRVSYTPHRRGAAGDEIVGQDAGGTVFYCWKSYGGDSNNDNSGIRWVSSAANDTVPGDDPNIVWDGYPSKIVGFFFEFVRMETGQAFSDTRGDILNKTIIWLLDDHYHPVVDVTYPNGGQVFSGNTATIYWNRTASPAVARQAAYYSDDAGQTWTLIDGNIPAGDTSYAWDISMVPNGNRYMISVVVYDSDTPPLSGRDGSTSTFTIQRPSGDTTGPATIPGSVRTKPNPSSRIRSILFNATITDELKGNSAIGEAEFFVQPTKPLLGDFGTGIPMTAEDGTYDSPVEAVEWQGPVAGSAWEAVGNYTVWVHGRDDPDGVPGSGDENWGTFYWSNFTVAPPPPDISVQPPAWVSAELVGGTFQDVRIIWGLSPDDPSVGGAADVDRYEVFRGTVYDSGGAGYAYLGQATARLSSFTALGDGHGNTNNYFYFVEAVDVNSNRGRSTDQAGKFTKYLQADVNLVSTPLIPYDPSTAVQLQTLNHDKAWTYDAFDLTDGWKSQATVKPHLGDFSTVDIKMGIWVNVLTAGYFTVAGSVPAQTSIPLNAGWNLVGYPSFTNDTIQNALTGIAYDRIEGYDVLDPYQLRALTPADIMHAGDAFWIHLPVGAVWDVTQ